MPSGLRGIGSGLHIVIAGEGGGVSLEAGEKEAKSMVYRPVTGGELSWGG